jgi:hypothetical protein
MLDSLTILMVDWQFVRNGRRLVKKENLAEYRIFLESCNFIKGSQYPNITIGLPSPIVDKLVSQSDDYGEGHGYMIFPSSGSPGQEVLAISGGYILLKFKSRPYLKFRHQNVMFLLHFYHSSVMYIMG